VAAERRGDRSWMLHLGFGVVRHVRGVVGSVVKVVVPQTTVTIVSRKEESWERAAETAENVEVSATSRRVGPGCMDGAWDEERKTQSVAAPEGLILSRPNLEVSLVKCDSVVSFERKKIHLQLPRPGQPRWPLPCPSHQQFPCTISQPLGPSRPPA
jgi:hypothetical protein